MVLKAHADHMLRDPTRSIKETANALGYAHVRAFYRAFKTWTGVPPGEFRGQNAGGSSDPE
jgi:AraC-like DNA-binding protein